MKYVIVSVCLLAAAWAAPAVPAGPSEAYNATLASGRAAGVFGFASYGGGTRGGEGGAVWTVWDAFALRDAISTPERRVVNVRGRIDLTALFTASPGVVLDVGSYKTIMGGDAEAMIFGGGLRIKRNSHVIIKNLKMHNAISYAKGEKPNGSGGIVNQVSGGFTEVDAILMEQAEYVWIDHNEFADDPWVANNIANNRMRHDGLVDIKRASNWITVSHNIFRNHNKCCLVGHSDSNGSQDSGKLKVSFQANWFMGTKQRNPRVRFGEVHVINNLYTDMGTYGIGVGAGASVFAERNVFRNSVAWRHPDGSAPKPIGNLRNEVNLLLSSTYDPVPSNVNWHPSQYFSYQSAAIGDVENHVRNIAGTL